MQQNSSKLPILIAISHKLACRKIMCFYTITNASMSSVLVGNWYCPLLPTHRQSGRLYQDTMDVKSVGLKH